ncbi:MAG: hypothetical protein C0485_16850 [Pirellula sp.]|nr:hypothetical protein [Pirellula sp.]
MDEQMHMKTAQGKADIIMTAFNIWCFCMASLIALAAGCWMFLGPKVQIIDSIDLDQSGISNPYNDLPADGPMVCGTSFLRLPSRFLAGKADPKRLIDWTSRQWPPGSIDRTEVVNGNIKWDYDEEAVKQAGLPEYFATKGDKCLHLQKVEKGLDHLIFINLSAGTFKYQSSGLDGDGEE